MQFWRKSIMRRRCCTSRLNSPPGGGRPGIRQFPARDDPQPGDRRGHRECTGHRRSIQDIARLLYQGGYFQPISPK